MPRNANGQYFLPDGNPVQPGELIKAEWANGTMDDIGNALTNSLDRSGAGGMTGTLKAVSGTALRPGISFNEDPATGIFKESQGVMALSASGIKQAYVTQNGLFVTTAPSDKMEVANKQYVDALASQATEIIMSFGAQKTPEMLPTNGYIPANWDAQGVPAFAIQFQAGQAAVYRPANTADPLYNNVYVYVSTNTVAAAWIDIGTVAGPPGPQGETGPIGPIGPQGPEGAQGPTGATGPLGPPGPTGAQGPQGPQGEKGDTGTAGQSVTIVGAFGKTKTPADLPASGLIPKDWDSPGNPANDIQLSPGDALIYTECETTNPQYGNLYEFVGTGTGFDANGWVDLGDMKGPKGDTGPQGPQGIQGNTGPQGPAGTDGAQGPQGPAGEKGATGDKGDPGQQGPQGIKGDTGPQGPKGDTGPQGPAGPSGGVASVNGLTGAVTLNYNSVGAPSTTGVNATGSNWNIGILGNAATATKLAATLPIANGGTGATTAAAALTALGGASLTANNTYTGTQTCAQGWSISASAGIGPTSVNIGGASTSWYYGSSAFTWTISNGAVMQIGGTPGLRCLVSQAYKPGGGAWADTSDRRLKTDVQTLTTCLDTITALNPVQYTWVGGYRSAAPQVGFIADEVEQVIPSAVSEYIPDIPVNQDTGVAAESPDDQAIIDILGEGVAVKTVGFKNDIFAYLVGAIKELKAEVDALKAQVAK